MRTAELLAFIKEREAIRVKKEAGKPRPWTANPILDKFRFCNVRRNDDRVTRWIHEWAFVESDWRNHEDLWFAIVVARLFNNEETLRELTDAVLPFDPSLMRRILQKRKLRKEKNFNAAYIVSTNGRAMDKVDYVIDCILKPMWKDRKRLRPAFNDTLDTYHMTLCQYQGMGSFMAAQVVGDLKYAEMCPLRLANDWNWWAASGPGSKRGLARVMWDDVAHTYNETVWRHEFHGLWEVVNKKFEITGQDLQNCLCEFDKYERARLGQGEPKQIYKDQWEWQPKNAAPWK